jgi:tRNA modification GTPase
MFDDTIAAIATSIGEAGLAVIRLSGRDAVTVADRCFVRAGKQPHLLADVPTHTIHFGRILQKGRIVDEVLVSVMRAPRTFTREDVVEISCHGGILPARLVLETVFAAGARAALPGEFTRRAFLNGRIDLTQAEAVVDLIHARSELALQAANEQLAGKLSSRLKELRDELLTPLAHVEAHIDFPDEDIAPDTRAGLSARLAAVSARIEALLCTAKEGQILRQGIRAAIVGRPNTGKSSLLNQLLGRDRAIVSPLPGTTRDTIEETANIRGLPIVFVDTAGLRVAESEIEQEGIRRSHAMRDRAELILHVLDSSVPLTPEDQQLLAAPGTQAHILVCNKSDLPRLLQFPTAPAVPLIEVCCLTGQGIESLKDAIKELIWSGAIQAEMLEVMINSRHYEALRRAQEGVIAAQTELDTQASLEFVAMELRIALNALGEITGQTITEDLLDRIFSQFCIGK